MILRKPYAILIKFFKPIHIALFLMFGYLLFKLRDIYVFFQDYVKTDVYTYIENIANNYISLPMAIISGIILILGLAIFYLMREKEKPVLFYRVLISYSVLLVFVLIIYYSFYQSLEFELYERSVLTIYRDVIGFFYYITYFFIGFCFVRGFGFDIKKFSFDKDLKVLNISETDSEEFELSLDVDKENIVSFFRREKRMFKYFLKENAVILIIILLVSIITAGIWIYRNIYVVNVVYQQDDSILANNLEYSIRDVYLVDEDKNNQILGNKYLIISFSIVNRGDDNSKIELTKTRLLVNGKEKIYPYTKHYDWFSDLGTGYNNQVLKPLIINDYILIFEVGKNISLNDKIVFQLYDNEVYENNELTVNRKNINLSPNLLKENSDSPKELNEFILFENTFLKKGSLSINKYEIANKFFHEYEECNGDDCQKYKKVIQSSNSDNKILKLNIDFEDIDIGILDNYSSLVYSIGGQKKQILEKDFNFVYNDNKTIYFEVSDNLENATNVILKINVRGSVFEFIIKK